MEYFEIGKIVNTQGLKGEVRIFPMTDVPDRFSLLDEIQVFFKNETKVLNIDSVRLHKQFVVIKFKEINTIEEGEALRGGVIKIPADQALPLSEGEYYIRDLYGMAVFTTDGEDLGVIADIIVTGANDVYSVENKATGQTILIPAIRQCIINVDLGERKMTVELLEGLR